MHQWLNASGFDNLELIKQFKDSAQIALKLSHLVLGNLQPSQFRKPLNVSRRKSHCYLSGDLAVGQREWLGPHRLANPARADALGAYTHGFDFPAGQRRFDRLQIR
jgi:hypothetical protein